MGIGNLDKIKAKVNNKKTIIGTSVTFSDPSIVELLADIGFDFIWIDTEHSGNDRREVLLNIMATRGTDAVGFVRIP